MILTFICLDCAYIFEEPKHWVEKHGFLHPPWEEWSGCPHCGGSYAGTIKCDICGEYIAGTYVKTSDGQLICENCYVEREVGNNDISL